MLEGMNDLFYELILELKKAEKSIQDEGTISLEEVKREFEI